MTVYGIAAMFIFFLTFASTKEVVPPTVSQAHTSLKEDFKGLTGQAWILFLLNLFCFSLYVVRSTTVIYYFKYNLGRTEWLSLVGVLGILSGLPMLLALPALEKKYSRKSLMFVSVALYVAGDLLIFAGRNSAACLLAGLIAAFQGFFVKGGMGLTSFIIGEFLKHGGYVANAVQTEKALSYIEICFIWIPIILCALIAVLAYFYKLDGIRVEMTKELESRREKLEAVA